MITHRVTYAVTDAETFCNGPAQDAIVSLGDITGTGVRITGWKDIPAILSIPLGIDSDRIDVLTVDGKCYTCAGTGERRDKYSDCEPHPGSNRLCVSGGRYPHTVAPVCDACACYSCHGKGTL